MRELKFRAWYNNQMWYKLNIIHTTNGNPLFFAVDNSLNHSLPNGIALESNTPIMQYTGLKDVNGVEIYEGDIITYTFESEFDAYESTEEVEYDEQTCGFMPFTKGICWRADVKYYEVIGNKFENPELLKKMEGD